MARDRSRPALRTTAGRAVAVVAASLLAACGQPTAEQAPDPATASDSVAGTTAPVGLAGRRYRLGDCVTWDQGPGDGGRVPQVVPCDQPHLIEITGRHQVADPPAVDGTVPTVGYPTDEEWDVAIQAACGPMAEAYLGGPLDPYGRFAATAIHPTPETWAAGDRTLWCGIMAYGASLEDAAGDRLVPFTGAVKTQSQFVVHGAGTCVPEEHNVAVPCTEPHLFEVVGTVDLTDRVPSPPPVDDDAAWEALVGADCRSLATRYLGTDAQSGVSPGWMPLAPESWAAGRRVVECFVGRPEGDGWQTVTGSLRDTTA